MSSSGSVLLMLLVAAALVAAVIWYVQTTKKKPAVAARRPVDVIGEQDKASIDQLKQIVNGDVIHYESQNWFVRGRIVLNEHGYQWTEHLLDDSTTKRWLCVEEDEGFEVSLWHSIAAGDIEQGQPGDRDVIVAGIAYRLQEEGVAAYTAEGATGTAPAGQVRYADYASVDGKLLGFENFGARWDAALGETLQPWELTVFGSTDRPATL